jgi:hypothetical protein
MGWLWLLAADARGFVQLDYFIVAGSHGDVDVFENLARRDAQDSIGGLDQVVSLAARVLAAQ